MYLRNLTLCQENKTVPINDEKTKGLLKPVQHLADYVEMSGIEVE